jgi:hypothetical protein
MPKCPGCGNETPGNARFCPLCGAPSNATIPPGNQTMMNPVGYAAAPESGKNKTAMAVGFGVVAVAIAAFLLFKASGLLAANKTEAPKNAVLNAPVTQTVQAPVMNAPPVKAPPAPVIQPPPNAENPMPEDVIAYLRWLKQFEGARRSLESKGAAVMTSSLQDLIKEYTTGASMGLLDGDSGVSGTTEHKPQNYAATIGAVIQEWNQASGVFQQKIPPDPCAALATSYGGALRAGVDQMSQLQGILTSAQQSMQNAGGNSTPDAQGALTQLFEQKNSRGMSKSVDQQYGDSNAALDAVRGRYTSMPDDISRQNFSIQTDGGSLMMPPGLGL